MQAEMLEAVIAIGTTNGAANSVVQTFNHGTGEAFVEVVEELVPPIQECLGELYQLRDSADLGFVQPSLQKQFSLRAVVDFVGNRDKAFFEQL